MRMDGYNVGYNGWDDFVDDEPSKKILIGISGKIGSGKDTLAGIIKDTVGLPVEIRKFAGPLKEIAAMLTGVDVIRFEDQEFKKQYAGDQWGMTYREILQKLGTDAMRNGLHENTWVNAAFAKDFENVLIFTDVRFPNEAQGVKDRGGILIRINRDSGNTLGVDHPSETSLDNFDDFDYVIQNNGPIEDLIKIVRSIEIAERW